MWQWRRNVFSDLQTNADRSTTPRLTQPITYPPEPPTSPAMNAQVPPVSAERLTRPPNLKTSPPTLKAELANPQLNRPIVFDPALKHFVDARRAGEPSFAAKEEALRWTTIRYAVLDHILHVIAATKWRDHLVLRGSVLLVTWYGNRARKPGDIDWVVIPGSWKLGDRNSREMLAEIEHALRGSTIEFDQPLSIPDRSFATTKIWSYERAPGQRMIVPWIAENSALNGTIQLDFVFAEPLPSPPVSTLIQLTNHPPANLLAATPEQSLCWKLLWLATDFYASGKDLFDAVLLAESTSLNWNLLKSTFEFAKADGHLLQVLDEATIKSWHVEWDDFQAEYPQHGDSEEVWKRRLSTALGLMSNE